MRIVKDETIDLADFDAWGGAENTIHRLIAHGKCEELDAILTDMYPDGMDETSLNDLLRYEDDSIYGWVGLKTYSELKTELEGLQEELEELKETINDEYQDELYDAEQETGMELTESERDTIWKQVADNYDQERAELLEKIKEIEDEIDEDF